MNLEKSWVRIRNLPKKKIFDKILGRIRSTFDKKHSPIVEEGTEKGVALAEYPLGATYAERLEALPLEVQGNPYLKETLIHNIEAFESKGTPVVMVELAESYGLSQEALVELFHQRLSEFINQCEFFRATNYGVFLNQIIDGDQRYKSQFETQTSDGTLRPSYRSEFESKQFGFPPFDTTEGQKAVEYRPIYGYFSPDANGVMNSEGKNPPSNSVSSYGRVTVKIKREVARQRATLTFSDSLGQYNMPPSPVALPHIGSIECLTNESDWVSSPPPREDLDKFLRGEFSYQTMLSLIGFYSEVQYHGGLGVDDIEAVHLSVHNGLDKSEVEAIREKVKKYNSRTGRNIKVIEY